MAAIIRQVNMSVELYSRAAELSAQRKPFAIATVVRVEGSSSARRGSKALIDAQGKIVVGWVGGGCAESAVRSEAVKCIQQERPELITLDLQDELLGVGMPCGGLMDVYIEPVVPNPELLIVGHGRIAETLATLGHVMNFFVTVSDPAASKESFPQADSVVSEDFDLTETTITPRTHVVIATLHKSDHIWLQRALESDAAYVALIASAHRAKLVLDYLLLEGVPQAKADKVWSPAGLDLGAATPEEIALSIIGQIVLLRRRGIGIAKLGEQAGVATDKIIRQCDVDG